MRLAAHWLAPPGHRPQQRQAAQHHGVGLRLRYRLQRDVLGQQAADLAAAVVVEEVDLDMRRGEVGGAAVEGELEDHVVGQRNVLAREAQAAADVGAAAAAVRVQLIAGQGPVGCAAGGGAQRHVVEAADVLQLQGADGGRLRPVAGAVGGIDFQGQHVVGPGRREGHALELQGAGLGRGHGAGGKQC